MKKLLLLLLLIPLAGFAFATAATESENSYDYADFTGVTNKCAVSVAISVGKGFSVNVKGDPDYIEDLEIDLHGNDLVISYRRSGLFRNDRPGGTVVYIGMPSVEAVTIKGSGGMAIEGKNNADRFEAELHGSGDLRCAELGTENLEINQHGSGSTDFSGQVTASEVKIRLSGSGAVEMASLVCSDAELSGNGSADIRIDRIIADYIDADITGSGDLELGGSVYGLTFSGKGSGELRAGDLVSGETRLSLFGSGSAEVSVSDESEIWLSVTGSGNIDIYGKPSVREQKRLGSGDIEFH